MKNINTNGQKTDAKNAENHQPSQKRKKKKIEKPQLITNWNAFVEKEANKCWQGCS